MSVANKALSQAKIRLLMNKKATFISSVLFSLNLKWDESIPTACVDGVTMSINPDFFVSLSLNERMFILVHETWHIAFKHIQRFRYHKNKSKEENELSFLKYNYAADYVINLQCKDDGFSIPEGGLIDEQYRGMSTEQIYNLLKDDPDEDFDPSYGDMTMPGPSGEGDSDSQNSRVISSKIDSILLKAATQQAMSKSPGKLPGEVSVYIEAIKNPKLPWNRILQRYMDEFNKSDFSWTRPNRRYMPHHYLPSLHANAIDRLTVAWDLSFSVSDDDIAIMMGEVEEARKKLNPTVTQVLGFDTRVVFDTSLSMHEPITKVQPKGRGGTSFDCVMQYLVDKRIKPNVLIMFTDMGDYPCNVNPQCPVIWIAINAHPYFLEQGQPFGHIIEYKTD